MGDVDLLTRLQLQGFQGPDYRIFTEELARYGVAVLTAWMYTGDIFTKAKERGFGLPPLPDSGWTREDREDLAHDTVVHALIKFREQVLVPGRWKPEKGAALKTFFIGQCLIRFPNFYRAWLQQQAEHRRILLTDDPAADLDRALGDVADGVARRDTIDRELAKLGPRLSTIVLLTERGYDQTEIAQRLGTTRKAVERALDYHRTRKRNRREQAS